MALKLGDQVLLCLCFVKLFCNGPLRREETDITNHMKPVYCLGEAVVLDFLVIDVQMNKQAFSICLYLKVPLEFSLWVLLYEQCGLPLGNAVAGTGLLRVRMEIRAELEWMFGLKGCPKRERMMLFHGQGVLHRWSHHASISPAPMCYRASHLWQPFAVNSSSRAGISRARRWFHTVTWRCLNNKWPAALQVKTGAKLPVQGCILGWLVFGTAGCEEVPVLLQRLIMPT